MKRLFVGKSVARLAGLQAENLLRIDLDKPAECNTKDADKALPFCWIEQDEA